MSIDQQIMYTCAFRYALGRMTYVVDSVAGELERAAHELPAKDLQLYIKEINEAIQSKAAGMNMDIQRWQNCRDVLCDELSKRQKQ